MKAFVNEMKLLEERKDFIFNRSENHYWNITGRRKYPELYQTIQPILEKNKLKSKDFYNVVVKNWDFLGKNCSVG